MRESVIAAQSPARAATNAGPRARVAYMMSRFPKITETFVLYEIVAVQAQGVPVEVYPLQRERTTAMHPEAAPLVERAHFLPMFTPRFLRAHAYYLRRRPRAYLGALWDSLRATWGSARYFGGILAFFPKTVEFARMMERDGITHIHAHFASHPAAAAFIIHRLTGIPYSFTAHGSDLHRDQHMLREKIAESAFTATISEYNVRVIAQTCGEDTAKQVTVLRCGVDTSVFAPRPRAGANGGHDQPLMILNIGTLHEVKGQTYLIEACRLLKERGLSFTCHFVGDGPDQAALEAQAAAAQLGERVVFHGRRERQAVVDLLQQAAILVAPSVPSSDNRREGIPVVLMEAMASGVTVVASDLSGIPELVIDGESGLLTPPGDAQAIADALERLARDPALRQRLADGGREKVLREFDLTTNAAALSARFTSGVVK